MRWPVAERMHIMHCISRIAWHIQYMEAGCVQASPTIL